MVTYEQALKSGKRKGASHCDDRELLAMLLETSIQLLCGAVSPKLVFEGAVKRGLSSKKVMEMARTDPARIEGLMWVARKDVRFLKSGQVTWVSESGKTEARRYASEGTVLKEILVVPAGRDQYEFWDGKWSALMPAKSFEIL